jgi:hypothetical protein
MKRLKLTPTAMSVLETDVLDHVEGFDPDDGYEAIRVAYRNPGVLLVTDTNKDALNKALTELSNACDYLGEGRDLKDADERKVYRAAARTFATLSGKAWRA